jgi:hypothetical protein
VNFEEEFAVLAAWLRQKTKEYNEASDKERRSGKDHGLDSELNAVHRQDIAEYNRRLDDLKAKYGIDP